MKIVLYLLFSVLLSSVAHSMSTDAALKQAGSVVTVEVNNRDGRQVLSENGFIVNSDGILALSCNAVTVWFEKPYNTLSIMLEDGTQLFAEDLISTNCENNIALITVGTKGLQAVSLAPKHKSKPGDVVTVIRGTSREKTGISRGTITYVREHDGLMKTSLSLSTENNGDPVFNAKGEVIGIVTTLWRFGRAYNFVIPARHLSREMNKFNRLISGLLKASLQEPPVAHAEASVPKPQTPTPPAPAPAPSAPKAEKVPIIPPVAKAVPAPEPTSALSKAPAAVPLPSPAPAPAHVAAPAPMPLPVLSQPITSRPVDIAAEHFNKGKGFFEMRKYEEAAAEYRSALAIKPDNLQARLDLGQAYYKLGRYSEAIEAYKQAAAEKKNSAEIYNRLGVIHMANSDFSMAVDVFRQAAKIEPNNAETHYSLGVALYLAGNKSGAAEEYYILKKLDEALADNLFDLLY